VKGVVLELPSLRERAGDVPSLFRELLRRHTGARVFSVSTKAYEGLCLYAWPGNVRELEMLARRLAAKLADEGHIHRRHLPEEMHAAARPSEDSSEAKAQVGHATRREHDAERLARALAEASGNVNVAARKIGISRQRAYRLLKPS